MKVRRKPGGSYTTKTETGELQEGEVDWLSDIEDLSKMRTAEGLTGLHNSLVRGRV